METILENGKIINKKIPEVIEYSDQYKKEMKKLMRLNNIFSEFENKATRDLDFFIDESNRRYSKSKCGINLKALISSTRKKCLDESKKILKDDFYNNKIIKSEKEKMKHKNNVILYKNLKNSMNIVKNPELTKNKADNINKKKEIKNHNFNYDLKQLNQNEKIMDSLINEEQKSLSKSIDTYKYGLDQLKENFDNNLLTDKRKNINAHRKLNIYLPNLKMVNYAARKPPSKNNDRDDPAKKPDIHKLLPFSKLGKKNSEILLGSHSQSDRKKSGKKHNVLPYITEPAFQKNNQYSRNFPLYKDYQDTITVVVDSANKELFVNKNFDQKRGEVENILNVDEIPKVELYDDLAHKKTNQIKEERRIKNENICRNQNYLKLTLQQRMNLDIEKNIKLIKSVEDCLYQKPDKNSNK